jgi:hypothetical protein
MATTSLINYSIQLKDKKMKTFSASHLSKGNKTFPVKITIDSKGVTVKHPRLFGGNEEMVPCSMISKIDVDTPLAGYSTIIIHSIGHGKISAHGFTKAEVNEMKELIFEKI